MKATKLLLIALLSTAVAATSAVARPGGVRTVSSNWGNHHWGHHHHHGSHVFFNVGFGFPFGYGYPYYGYSPYGYYPYGYYSGPREVIYQAATVDRSTAVAVQRRLAQSWLLSRGHRWRSGFGNPHGHSLL